MVTLGMMGLATFLIGCIPSYETWGIAAPILILLMRAMQGLALGGDMAVLRPTSRSARQTAGVAFIRAGFNLRLSARHRIRVARLLSLRDAGTALPRSDEALKIKF
jgi:MFS family permease